MPCAAAIPNAAATVTPNDVRPPTSAAPSAGTMSSVIVVGSIDALIVAARIPTAAASTAEIIQLTAASRSGERPIKTAPFSSSAAARVARPKRVNRYAAQRATVAATTSPARISWSRAIDVPRRWTGRFSNSGLTATACEVKRSTTTDWSTSSSPTEATVLASGGAWRNGRNTRACMSSPASAATTRLRANAAPNVSGAPNGQRCRPVRERHLREADRVEQTLDQRERIRERAGGTARPRVAAP